MIYMTYPQIAGNRSINAMINRCFEHIHRADVPKFVKKFRTQYSDDNQVMHTFRELVLGAYLASRGLNVRYDHKVDSKRPDWCILDQWSALRAIVELTNFHAPKVTEDSIKSQLQISGFWVGWQEPNNYRLYRRIAQKSVEYFGADVAKLRKVQAPLHHLMHVHTAEQC